MKTNKSIIYLFICTLLFGFSACTNHFEEYNRNAEDADPQTPYLINASLLSMGDYIVPTDAGMNQFVECLMGGSWGGYLADSNDGFNGKNYSTYTPEAHWVQVTFNDIIPNTFRRHGDVYKAAKDKPVQLAIADILKVYAISKVTDTYGPIPYSKIGEGGALVAPYDSQESVYTQFFTELDAAIESLSENETLDFSPKADNVYNGKVVQWIKLANSLKLRLAMRIADVNPTLAKEKAQEAVSHRIGIIASNADNAMKPAPVKNPFVTIMYEWNDGDSRISADITSYMNGYKDPRRANYFTESKFTSATITNGFHGLRSGIQIPGGGIVRQYSNMNVKAETKLVWMTAAEVSFLRAEGALRGWNMGGGTAESFYNEGISLSFDQWGAGDAAEYLANATNKPEGYKDPLGAFSYTGTTSNITIKWGSGGDSFDKNLERIITQKWIANFPQGVEAWSEFRRTGYPKLMEVMRNNSGGKVDSKRMARRLSYPESEYTNNRANLNDAISQHLKGADDLGTDVWWAKKN